MRHPALSRMLGVFLAVVSLLTLVAGGLGFGRAGRDVREQQRGQALLESRIARAETLREELTAQQEAYDAAIAVYSERQEAHRSRSDSYRMKLATFTATRAGMLLGQKQLDEAAAALDESMRLFQNGLYLFRQGEEAFQKIYDAYLALRGTLDEGLAIYQQALSRLPAEGEEGAQPVFSPEEVLALAELGHSGYAQMSALLQSLRDETPADQREAGELIRRALEEYNTVGPELQSFSVEQLAWGVSRALYDEAEAAMERRIAEGMSPEEARATADELCRESFGLSFEELGQWLDESRPEEAEGSAGEGIPPEMLDTLLEALPGDRDILDAALGLIAEGDAALSDKEAAFRADPHDMSAAELLLEVSKEGLDSSERLLGLVEPTILQTKEQLAQMRQQLNLGWNTITAALQQVRDGYRQIDEKAAELLLEFLQMRSERRSLSADKSSLDALTQTVDSYETLRERYRSARAELLSDDAIYERQKADGDFLAAARQELAERVPESARVYRLRCLCCALVIAASLAGLAAALGAFEKLRLPAIWPLPLAAFVLAAAGEGISLWLGRGLWYSALFVAIFALALFPLCLGKHEKPGQEG